MMATKLYYKPTANVRKAISNYQKNKQLPIVTNCGRISFQKLNAFLKEAKAFASADGKKPNGLCIYLFRELVDPAKYKIYDKGIGERLVAAKKGSKFTQVSFLIVPALFDDKAYVTDLLPGSREIPVLFPGGEATGLCPPRCK